MRHIQINKIILFIAFTPYYGTESNKSTKELSQNKIYNFDNFLGLYEGAIEKLKKDYGRIPDSSTADGGFASKANIEYSQMEAIISNLKRGFQIRRCSER